MSADESQTEVDARHLPSGPDLAVPERQAGLVRQSDDLNDDQDFIEAVSVGWDDE